MRKHCFIRNMRTVRNSCKLRYTSKQSSMRNTRKTNNVRKQSIKRNMVSCVNIAPTRTKYGYILRNMRKHCCMRNKRNMRYAEFRV
jgi:hypothetical protein